MKFKGILITGTSYSGKSIVANLLNCEAASDNRKFEQVDTITTCDKDQAFLRATYMDEESFDNLANCESFYSSVARGDGKYGIRKDDLMRIEESGSIPVIITPPELARIIIKSHDSFMTFFLDASDDELMERFKDDAEKYDDSWKKLFHNQLGLDREYQDDSHYIVDCKDTETVKEFIVSMWNLQTNGGALSEKQIKLMIECGLLLRGADKNMIKGASYDLRLGDEYYYGGEIRKLSEEKPFLTIEPYDYAIVSCKEVAWLPRDVIAKFGLTVSLFCQGIILSNGTQIDPGFRGTLFCLLFNTSNRAVHLKRGKHYATIEFNKMIDYADAYEGKYQGTKNIIDYIPENALHGAINELKEEVTELKKENRIMQNIYLGVVALMFTMITILLMR